MKEKHTRGKQIHVRDISEKQEEKEERKEKVKEVEGEEQEENEEEMTRRKIITTTSKKQNLHSPAVKKSNQVGKADSHSKFFYATENR